MTPCFSQFSLYFVFLQQYKGVHYDENIMSQMNKLWGFHLPVLFLITKDIH